MSDEAPTTLEPAPARPPAPPPRPRPRTGHLLTGAVLVLLGVAWLLETTDVLRVSLGAVLAGLLILVGVALLALAPTGRHSGLIALGTVLALITGLAAAVDVRLEGGVGDRTERPASVEDLDEEYRLAIGQLTVDLTRVAFPAGETEVEASVGIGELVVLVPAGLRVVVQGHVGAGELVLFGEQHDGLDVDAETTEDASPDAAPTLELEVSAGLGSVKVERG